MAFKLALRLPFLGREPAAREAAPPAAPAPVAAKGFWSRPLWLIGKLPIGRQLQLLTVVLVALLAVALPRVARMALAAVLLMAAAVLVNLAPPNPYLTEIFRLWQQGHFLNFNGLTRLVATLWPFAAIGYLIVLAARRRDDGLL